MKRLKALMSFFGFFLKLVRKIPAFLGWIVLIVFLVSAVALGSTYYYIYHNRNNLPDIEPFIKFEPPAIGEAYDSKGQVIVGLAKEYRRINKYADMPPVVVQAVLSAEDKRFFWHHGVDYLALLQAAAYSGLDSFVATAKSWEEGEYTIKLAYSHGGSTLDQQLAKLYFQTGKTDSLLKKLDKVRLSVWLNEEMEKRYGPKAKEEIFARFVSFVYLGNGRYGFDAGAEHFFGKRVSDFGSNDVDKAAFLAGLVRHPFPSRNPRMEKYMNRRNEVLEQMAENGFVDQGNLRELLNKDVVLVGKVPKTIAPSVVSDMLEELNTVGFTDMQLFEGKIAVHTSLDLKVQEIANRALENGLKAYEERHPEAKGKIQGAVIVLRNDDAGILAEVGGRQIYRSRNLAYTDFNRAKHARRQPGSTFKPIVYLTAFRKKGFTLQDTAMDVRISLPMGPGQPRHVIGNYDGRYKGAIPVRQALAESRNAAAIWLTYRSGGIKEVIETAQLLGIKTKLEPYPTTAIGASVVNLTELANAFRTIASGLQGQPHLIEKVTDRGNEALFSRKYESQGVLVEEEAIREIQEGLRGNVRLPNGTAHSLDSNDFPIPVMGKTGTTNDFRDAFFAGSTYGVGGITVVVWIGFDDYRQLAPRETGARAALPIVKEIMLEAYGQGLIGPVPTFPENIEKGIDTYLHRGVELSNPQ